MFCLGVKPYKPAVIDFKKKTNSNMLKKIDKITKNNKSSKGKKDSEPDLSDFLKKIIMESTQKKSLKKSFKNEDPDKVIILNYHFISYITFSEFILGILSFHLSSRVATPGISFRKLCIQC